MALFLHSFAEGSCHYVSVIQTQGRTIQDNPKKAPPAVAKMINLQGRAPDAQLNETVPENQSYSQEFERWGTHIKPPHVPHRENKRSETQRQREMLWGGQEERMRNYARVWRFILRLDLEKWCWQHVQGQALWAWSSSSHLGSDSFSAVEKWGLLYKVHQSAGTHHFLFPTAALMQLLFIFFSYSLSLIRNILLSRQAV